MSEPELHLPVRVDRIAETGEQHEVVASPEACAALTLRMGIEAVHALTCKFSLTPRPGGVVLAQGRLRARVAQLCVVSLEPFDSDVIEKFRVRFVPEGREAGDEDPESDDEIPYTGGIIDLGEAATEQLALALDPYPRSPGVALPDSATDSEEGPFAALARLKRNQ